MKRRFITYLLAASFLLAVVVPANPMRVFAACAPGEVFSGGQYTPASPYAYGAKASIDAYGYSLCPQDAPPTSTIGYASVYLPSTTGYAIAGYGLEYPSHVNTLGYWFEWRNTAGGNPVGGYVSSGSRLSGFHTFTAEYAPGSNGIFNLLVDNVVWAHTDPIGFNSGTASYAVRSNSPDNQQGGSCNYHQAFYSLQYQAAGGAYYFVPSLTPIPSVSYAGASYSGANMALWDKRYPPPGC